MRRLVFVPKVRSPGVLDYESDGGSPSRHPPGQAVGGRHLGIPEDGGHGGGQQGHQYGTVRKGSAAILQYSSTIGTKLSNLWTRKKRGSSGDRTFIGLFDPPFFSIFNFFLFSERCERAKCTPPLLPKIALG